MPIIKTDKPLRNRHEHDFYPTPVGLCLAALNLLPPNNHAITALDPGAGAGPWGYAATQLFDCEVDGIEKYLPRYYAPYSKYYTSWRHYYDYLTFEGYRHAQYDLVMGNPPYKFAERFVRQSQKYLKPGGKLIFLLRLAFLEGQRRGKSLWQIYRPEQVWTCSRRPSFTGDGKTDATAYAIYIWGKENNIAKPSLDWLLWDYDPLDLAQTLDYN